MEVRRRLGAPGQGQRGRWVHVTQRVWRLAGVNMTQQALAWLGRKGLRFGMQDRYCPEPPEPKQRLVKRLESHTAAAHPLGKHICTATAVVSMLSA